MHLLEPEQDLRISIWAEAVILDEDWLRRMVGMWGTAAGRMDRLVLLRADTGRAVRKQAMRMRLLAPIVPVFFALALVGSGLPGLSQGDHFSPRDAHAHAAQTIDDRVGAAGDTVISALVAGPVTSIEVENNEHVSQGQVLFRTDYRQYQLAVQVAQANLAILQHRIVALREVYRQRMAGLAAAQDVLAYQRRVHNRRAQLLSRGAISQLEFDQASVAFLDAREKLLAEQCAITQTLVDLDNDPDLPIEQRPAVERAQAELDRAKLDLSHTVVASPGNGTVTNVDRLRVGEYVRVGTAVFDLAPERFSIRD